jgi:D-alanyl-D-alanine carboxypeptidase/D-alanyl-D-alanine-endopeptidase (penicillin-binding protein 4)
MMRRRAALWALLAGVLLALPAPACALGTGPLRARLAAVMRHAGPSAGAYAIDLGTGAQLFASRPDLTLAPASVEKLYTTSTALLRFGPARTLDTTVSATAPVLLGTPVRGNLYLQGGGDPTLTTARLQALAHSVRVLGITRVEGAVLADETLFDGLRGSYDTGYRLDSEIVGELGALVADRGFAQHRFQPSPALFAARRLVAALRREGVTVTGKTGLSPTPAGATVLARSRSIPVSALIAATNVPSDNFYAEMLLKGLGATFGGAGSTAAGAAVVRAEAAKFGASPRVVDGSGLSRADHTSPRQVVALLRGVDATDQGAAFVSSLPLAGRSGTLSTRMRGTPAQGRCRAKTGTLIGVSNLAGICTTASGERVAFAILMTNVSTYRARRLQDHMAAALATYEPGGNR